MRIKIKRGRSISVIVVLVAALVVPFGSVSAAGPGGGPVAALVDRLARADDPYAAYARLSLQDQTAVIDYLKVVKITEVSTLGAATGDPGTMTTTASGCWTWTWQRDGRNALGGVLWSYFKKIDWCGKGSTITSTPQRLRWGETYYPFWSWSHIGDQTWGGLGQLSYRTWTQGEFKLCVTPNVGCVQFSYPWLDMTAWGDGRGTGSVGG